MSFIIPREILEDGFDPETRRVLVELSIATLIMTIIMLPNFCFKTKYQAELNLMKKAGDKSAE